MALPDNTDPSFLELIDVYRHTDIRYPHLKGITLAQWALESGWGLSDLAMKHNNFAGMKWRPAMDSYGWPTPYTDWQGKSEKYVHFEDKAAFILGYWVRFSTILAYRGWEARTDTPYAFIDYVGPIWVGMSPTHNARYVADIKKIYLTHTRDLMKG